MGGVNMKSWEEGKLGKTLGSHLIINSQDVMDNKIDQRDKRESSGDFQLNEAETARNTALFLANTITFLDNTLATQHLSSKITPQKDPPDSCTQSSRPS